VPEAKISDLDEEVLKAARDKFIERNPKQAEQARKWDIKIVLDKLNITIDGKVTNTALILLGKTESSHYLLPSVMEITWALETVICLDKIQKKQKVENLVIKNLKKVRLIEGRKPNYLCSFKIADITDTKEQYIRNKGLDDIHYEGLILKYIKTFEKMNGRQIDNLILGKLPEILRPDQKINKISNLLKKMREKNLIENIGQRKTSLWKLKEIKVYD